LATKSIKLFVKEFSNNISSVKRLEIIISPKNKPSLIVAEKSGFNKEGLLRKKIFRDNKYHDAYIFSKLL
jgi:[ribosomal protein S5]-alanine N-acetyltransferase